MVNITRPLAHQHRFSGKIFKRSHRSRSSVCDNDLLHIADVWIRERRRLQTLRRDGQSGGRNITLSLVKPGEQFIKRDGDEEELGLILRRFCTRVEFFLILHQEVILKPARRSLIKEEIGAAERHQHSDIAALLHRIEITECGSLSPNEQSIRLGEGLGLDGRRLA